MFDVIPVGWFTNLIYFYRWCLEEQQELKPKGAQGQSMSIGDGLDAFYKKYPKFEDAYREWESGWRKAIGKVEGRGD